MAEKENPIDTILKKIDNRGVFQRRFYLLFIVLLSLMSAMPYIGIIVSVATPNHWCSVPGRENTNYTLEEWKHLTIPLEIDSKSQQTFSQCTRFQLPNNTNRKIVQCDNGWEYDNTWLKNTAVTQNNWVCNNKMIAANTLSFGFMGEILGNIIAGYVSDNYGRKPLIFISLTTIIIGRSMATITSSTRTAFLFFSMLGSLFGIGCMEGAGITALETAKPEDRALVIMTLMLSWNVGMGIAPLFMFWLRYWVTFLLSITLPLAIYFFFSPLLIESPRWLASKRKVKQCLKELQKIATCNKTEIPLNAEILLEEFCKEKSNIKKQSIIGLFRNVRMAKNTVLVLTSWSIAVQIYMYLLINTSNLGSNSFLTYPLQALADLPGFLIAYYIANRYGRRCTITLGYSLVAVLCIAMITLIQKALMEEVIITIYILMKFSISMSIFGVNLHGLELYPTFIRQNGNVIKAFFAGSCSSLIPYIVALGVSVNATIPYAIYLACALVGLLCTVLLPETLGHTLPESFSDAARFGIDQDIWGRSKPKVSDSNDGYLSINIE